jgi:hypothetical protein
MDAEDGVQEPAMHHVCAEDVAHYLEQEARDIELPHQLLVRRGDMAEAIRFFRPKIRQIDPGQEITDLIASLDEIAASGPVRLRGHAYCAIERYWCELSDLALQCESDDDYSEREQREMHRNLWLLLENIVDYSVKQPAA